MKKATTGFGLLNIKNNETTMKINLYFSSFILLLAFTTSAQITKGGSTKNYERYHITYDSIVTETKVPLKGFTEHLSFDIAYVTPTDEWSKTQMTQSEYLSNPYWASPFFTGQVGLTRGFSMGFGGITPLNSLNKNLIPNIDLGLNIKYGATFLGYSWRDIYTPGYVMHELFNESPTYGIFSMIYFGIGPSITLIPKPQDPKFALDLYCRFNANLVLTPNFSNIYFLSEGGWYDLETTRSGVCFDISPTLGFNLRFKGIKFFLENTINVKAQNASNGVEISEQMEIYESSTGNTDYYYNTFSLSNLLKLSNLQVGIGLPIN